VARVAVHLTLNISPGELVFERGDMFLSIPVIADKHLLLHIKQALIDKQAMLLASTKKFF